MNADKRKTKYSGISSIMLIKELVRKILKRTKWWNKGDGKVKCYWMQIME